MKMRDEIEIVSRGVCVKKGKLLVCRNRKKGNMYLPGGHVEFDESAKVSLKREIEEEMGLPSRVGRFLGACEHRFAWKKKLTCEINLVFELSIPGIGPSRVAPSVEDHLEFRWIPLSSLKRSRLEPFALKKLLPQWLAAKDRVARWASTYL